MWYIYLVGAFAATGANSLCNSIYKMLLNHFYQGLQAKKYPPEERQAFQNGFLTTRNP
jgi:hypothetical protein